MKVRSIFKWICNNIRFDTEAFWQDKPARVEPKDVLKCRVTVAKGYSNLFATLCKKIGLQVRSYYCYPYKALNLVFVLTQAESIDGLGKGGDFGTMALTTPEVEHSWNSVCVNNEWVRIPTSIHRIIQANNTTSICWTAVGVLGT